MREIISTRPKVISREDKFRFFTYPIPSFPPALPKKSAVVPVECSVPKFNEKPLFHHKKEKAVNIFSPGHPLSLCGSSEVNISAK